MVAMRSRGGPTKRWDHPDLSSLAELSLVRRADLLYPTANYYSMDNQDHDNKEPSVFGELIGIPPPEIDQRRKDP